MDYNSEEYEAQKCPRFNSKHILVNLRVSLTVLNPDFTGVIWKSAYCIVQCAVKSVNNETSIIKHQGSNPEPDLVAVTGAILVEFTKNPSRFFLLLLGLI